MPIIPYGSHSINDDDVDAVVNVLRNEFLTQGQQVPAFEDALCQYTGAKFCTAVNSATSGLHVACLALGVGQGDIIWTSANSFAASANCARYCSADVDFVDIDAKTGNICPDLLAQKLAHAASSEMLPTALIVVHFSGLSCEMKQISKLCAEHNIKIIEDAAHGLGGTYENQPIGCCQYSDLAVLSFHPVKSITSAEGGAILTNQPTLAEKCQLFSKHGITRDIFKFDKASEGDWYYQQLALGFNYRLSDLHAALGRSQLVRVDNFIKKRRIIAERYFDAFKDMPIILPSMESANESAWHLYIVQVEVNKRHDIFSFLRSKDIGVNVHYIPIYKHPYYQSSGFENYSLNNTELYYSRAISLPIFPNLDNASQQRVIETLRHVIL